MRTVFDSQGNTATQKNDDLQGERPYHRNNRLQEMAEYPPAIHALAANDHILHLDEMNAIKKRRKINKRTAGSFNAQESFVVKSERVFEKTLKSF